MVYSDARSQQQNTANLITYFQFSMVTIILQFKIFFFSILEVNRSHSRISLSLSLFFFTEFAAFICNHNCITWLTWTQWRQRGGYFIISASSTLFIKDVLPSLGLPIMATNQISVPF